MNVDTIGLLVAALLVAWVVPLFLVIQYCKQNVPKRLEEIQNHFTAEVTPDNLASPDDRLKSGAWHYARLLNPNSPPPTNPEEVIKRQFYRFHGTDRYVPPTALVFILSGLMLAFSGLWISYRLTSAASPVSKVAGAGGAGGVTNKPAGPNDGAAGGADKPAPEAEAVNRAAIMLERIPIPFLMALWGAYVWSLYELLSRRRSGDLTPVELYEIACRYITAIPIGYAFSLLVFDTVPSFAAFVISAFPLREIKQLFRKYTLSKIDPKPATLGAPPGAVPAVDQRGLIGDILCGIGNDTVARLAELEIETFIDLAYVDPIRLMIKTGAPIRVVLSWIDQALVPVYAASHKAKLALLGMPCALDVCEFYVRHCYNPQTKQPRDWQNTVESRDAVTQVATKLDIPPINLVEQIMRSIYTDPNTQFLIRVWYGPAAPGGM